MSTISVLPALDADVPTLFGVVSQSFGHDAPFVDAYFPRHDTVAGAAAGASRLLAWKRSSPEAHFLKAVVDDVVVGVAVWTLMYEAPPSELRDAEDVDGVWGEDAEYMESLWRMYVRPRTGVVERARAQGRGVWVLELLAVHRDYQRRGAGSGLVNWGTERADEQGFEAIVEATPAGRRTYEKCGFRVEIEEMDLDVGEKFKERTSPLLIFLRREAKG